MAERKMWTDEENAILFEMKREGRTAQEIADALGRSESSVNFQCSRLKVKQQLMLQKAKNSAEEAIEDVEVEEYTEGEMRAATRADQSAKEASCVQMSVIPVGDSTEHSLGKLPFTPSWVTVPVKELVRTLRDAKTVRHTVEDLIAMLHAEESKKTEGFLALGALFADVSRLVEDLEELQRGE